MVGMPSYAFIFILLAAINLALQLVKDVETLRVDSRKNFFMLGAGVSLAVVSSNSLMFFGLGAVIFVFNYLVHKYETKTKQDIFGDGDKEVMAWLVPGLIVVGLNSVIIYLVSFVTLTLFFGLIQKKFKLLDAYVPGLLFICISFVLGISLIQ